MFLASMDKRVSKGLSEMRVLRIFRYVDDFLVFVDDHSGICFNDVTKVVKLFDAMSDGLNFTRDKRIQFLGLQLTFTGDITRAG